MKKVETGKEPVYDNIASITVEGSEWYRLSGPYSYTGTNVTNLELYIEGPQPGVSYYVDDVTVTEVGSAATWKEEANARIEQIRKRDAKIRIVDSNNKPVSGVSIDVRQVKHEFGFGSAITMNGIHDPRYTEFFKNNYEWAVFENEAKWYSNESSQGNVSYANADYLYNWCAENGIKVRGHCIFWEPEEWQPSWLKGLTGDALMKAIDARLESVVPHFRGKFLHWDVNNEMLHGDFFKSRLGESIWPYMFKRARELDPDAKLFVNDYNIITYVEGDAYIRQIEWLLQNGAEIDGHICSFCGTVCRIHCKSGKVQLHIDILASNAAVRYNCYTGCNRGTFNYLSLIVKQYSSGSSRCCYPISRINLPCPCGNTACNVGFPETYIYFVAVSQRIIYRNRHSESIVAGCAGCCAAVN